MFIQRIILTIFLISFLGCASQQTPKTPSSASKTKSKPALQTQTKKNNVQSLLNRALVLTYGFNHSEANKVFKEAAKIDPKCAICYWGAALVLGPNINAPMDDNAVPEAYYLTQTAVKLSSSATPRDQALIKALSKRYSPKPVKDRKLLDQAYANAMRQAAKDFPNDSMVLTLLAEALMNLHPWDYWDKTGAPKSWTPEIINTIDSALKIDPNQLGANHLHIHAVEASPNPQRAEESADRLRELAPDSGHLLHMPAHIYMRIGRYEDAAKVNEHAIINDESYKSQKNPKGIYPLAYMPHNRHFLWIAAANIGQSKRAIQAAIQLSQAVDQKEMRKPGYGTLQNYWVMPFYAWLRFGKWQDILKAPKPDKDMIFPQGIWHYARGRAFTALGKLKEAKGELTNLKKIMQDPSLKNISLWDINNVSNLLVIADHLLEGELAYKQKKTQSALSHLTQAVNAEDKLKYDEPPAWYYPARHSLGTVLLELGYGDEAERVFRKDLERHKDNGWALFGLMKSLEAQKKTKDASAIKKRFEAIWGNADIKLTRARF